MFYSKKVIMDYVCGNDIVGYEIEQLENDYRFMIDVIKYTGDKRIYKLCSDKVKNNPDFVKFLVDFFRNDKQFVINIISYYFKKNSCDDNDYYELLIMITDIVKFDGVLGLRYGLKLNSFYELEKFKTSIISSKSDVNFGRGFFLILDKYGSSKIIMDYFAKRFIDEIFYIDEMGFEALIHDKCRDVNIIKSGINKFIINYISSYDEILANYVEVNLGLIEGVKRDLVKVVNKWDSYLENINYNKCTIFYEEMFKIMDYYDCVFEYSYDDVANYVITKLGLEEIFSKYYFVLENHEFNTIKKNNLSILELKCLSDIVKMAKILFSRDVIDGSDDVYLGFSRGKKKNGNKKGDFE